VLVPVERATVSVYDRGFLYGDAVFETIRTYEGEPFRLEEHIDRLGWSAERVGMKLTLSSADQVAEVRSALKKVEAERGEPGDLVARIMITRGEGPFGLDPAGATTPCRVLFIHPYRPLPDKDRTDGVSAITYATYRPSDAARGAKVGNYLESIVALREARARGAHEAIILGVDGQVLEGTTSNVFAVRGGRLLTPPTSLPILPGITRGLVLDAASDAGLVAEERPLAPADLHDADELFVTSTIRELLSITRIDDRPVGAGVPGPKTRALYEAFRRNAGLPPP
jgi:branched-chain amino acid aminotransferase